MAAGQFTLGAPPAPAAEDPIIEAPAAVETVPSDVAGDTMDDPTIWVDPTDPTRSVIIGADHRDNSLSVYDLSGARLQKLPLSHGNNVDLRSGFSLSGETTPILGLAGSGAVSFYRFDPATRRLSNVTPGGEKIGREDLEQPGEGPFYAHGMCLYNSPVSGRFYAFVVDRYGTIKQLELTDGGNGKVAFDEVRQIKVEPRPAVGNADQTEACVADEVGRSLFVAEQDWHIWRYGAEPTDPTGTAKRVMVDSEVTEGGHFTREAEGLAVVNDPGGASYLIASSQKADAFTVYRGSAPYEFIRQVKVVGSATADGCENTDGIDAVAANLGPAFPEGILICQDNNNTAPAPGNMNFKVVRLEHVVPLADGPLPAPSSSTTTTTTTTTPGPGAQTGSPGPGAPQPASPLPRRSGYWMLGSAGKVFPFGDARTHGNAPVTRPARAVDLEPTPSGNGYWVIDDRGAVFAHGDAAHHGVPAAARLTTGETVTSLSATRTGAGYWIFTSLGRAFAFGDATHVGDLAGTRLNAPVLDSITAPSGRGYYMVAADGGIFAFGDAQFHGSMGGVRLNRPVQSVVPDPDAAGYWLVAADGGIFAFDAPFHGSMGGMPLNRPVTGMVGSRSGNGYLMVAEDGGIFAFGDAAFRGSLGAQPPPMPIVAVAALP
ncbi:MAG: phytase [Actinomycetota bacterium]|nr:phytase [Actinomycetota bacterium]